MKRKRDKFYLIPIPKPLLPMTREQRELYRLATRLQKRAETLCNAAGHIVENVDRERGADIPPRVPSREAREHLRKLRARTNPKRT